MNTFDRLDTSLNKGLDQLFRLYVITNVIR